MGTSKMRMSRREFLRLAGMYGAGAAMAAACGRAAATPAATGTAVPASVGGATPATAGVVAPSIQGGPLEVGVLYEEGKWYDLVKALGDGLENDYPGTKITYTFNNTATDAARALRWQGGNPLDVDTNMFSSKIPSTHDHVDEGMLLDLTPFLERPLATGEKPIDAYLPMVRSFCTDLRPGLASSGKWFSAPENLYLMLIHYNVKAFEEMGVEPATTWPEFLDLCATINEKGKETGMKPIGVSNLDIHLGQWWDRITQRFVGRETVENVLYGDGHLADDPGFLAAATELGKLSANGWLMDGWQGMDNVQAQTMFFQGKAAMFHMGSWLIPEMADAIPEGFECGVFDFPAVPEGSGDQKSLFGGGQFWSIANPEISTSHEVNAELAFEYLRRFTGKEAADERVEVLGAIAATNGSPAPTKLPGVDAILANGSSDMTFLYYGVYMDSALWAAWYPAPMALWMGDMTPEEMVKKIDQGLDTYRSLKYATPTP